MYYFDLLLGSYSIFGTSIALKFMYYFTVIPRGTSWVFLRLALSDETSYVEPDFSVNSFLKWGGRLWETV
jgi:hypothetical protein